jgi:hypothetical protein
MVTAHAQGPQLHELRCTGWFLAHEALRTDMRLMAEALTAVQTRLDADGMLKTWQVNLLTSPHLANSAAAVGRVDDGPDFSDPIKNGVIPSCTAYVCPVPIRSSIETVSRSFGPRGRDLDHLCAFMQIAVLVRNVDLPRAPEHAVAYSTLDGYSLARGHE